MKRAKCEGESKRMANHLMKLGAMAALSLAPMSGAIAADLSWSGFYRVEGLRVHGSELNSAGSDKAYMLHHLVLQPKIVAADGVTIYARFDVFNNATFGADSQLGDFFGSGPRAGYGGGLDNNQTTNAGNSNVLSRTQKAGSISVTSLYAVWAHEFGSLIVGRTPMQFGLGLVHNAGNGAFDHWFSTKDIVAYKAVMGNLFVMPMIGKVSEADLGHEDDVNDYMVQVQYDNPDTDLSLGAFFEQRIGTLNGNDVPVTGTSALGTSQTGGFKSQTWSVFVKRKLSDFTIGVEGDFVNGDTGAVYAPGANVSMNAFAVAGELAWKPEASRWSSVFKFGFVSGDDPGTRDVYEGFVFSRNYDVGFILFNHPVGQYDALRTGTSRDASVKASSQPDTESVSNAIYAAPRVDFRLKDNLSLNGTFVYAMLNNDPVAQGSTAKDLGYELDLGVTYKPYDRLVWKTQAGFLIPGGAWRGSGTLNYENRVAYGIETKAAISF